MAGPIAKPYYWDFAPQLMGNVRALGLRFGVEAAVVLAAGVLVSFGNDSGKEASCSPTSLQRRS